MSLVDFFFNGDYRERILFPNPTTATKDISLSEDEIQNIRAERARQFLNILTNNIMYKFVNYKEVTEEHFRNSYQRINTTECY